jgi:hypothetical protein
MVNGQWGMSGGDFEGKQHISKGLCQIAFFVDFVFIDQVPPIAHCPFSIHYALFPPNSLVLPT